jgi:hypothetical protein
MATRGPNTAAGKLAVSQNALKHGLRSASPVLPGEDPLDWRDHRQGVFESLQPEGHFEAVLAERIANLTWRLHRVTRYETAVAAERIALAEEYVAEHQEDDDDATPYVPGDVDPDRIRHVQATHALPKEFELERIMRYEAHLHRQWVASLHELEALQARRKGLPAHLARLDIALPPLLRASGPGPL